MALFVVGTPRVLRCCAAEDEVVSLAFDSPAADEEVPLLAVATSRSLQLWGGGQHRVKLCEHVRPPACLAAHGLGTAALWRPGHAELVLLVRPPCVAARVCA